MTILCRSATFIPAIAIVLALTASGIAGFGPCAKTADQTVTNNIACGVNLIGCIGEYRNVYSKYECLNQEESACPNRKSALGDEMQPSPVLNKDGVCRPGLYGRSNYDCRLNLATRVLIPGGTTCL